MQISAFCAWLRNASKLITELSKCGSQIVNQYFYCLKGWTNFLLSCSLNRTKGRCSSGRETSPTHPRPARCWAILLEKPGDGSTYLAYLYHRYPSLCACLTAWAPCAQVPCTGPSRLSYRNGLTDTICVWRWGHSNGLSNQGISVNVILTRRNRLALHKLVWSLPFFFILQSDFYAVAFLNEILHAVVFTHKFVDQVMARLLVALTLNVRSKY